MNVADGKSYLYGALKFAVINRYRSLAVQNKYQNAIIAASETTENRITDDLEEKELDT